MSIETNAMGEITSLSTENMPSDLGSATDFQEQETPDVQEGLEQNADLQEEQVTPEDEDGLNPSGEEELDKFSDEKKETAFSKRLAKERQKLESKIKSELEAEYSRYKKLAKIGAEQYGMTEAEYIKALEEQQREAQREKYQGLSDEDIEALEWAKQNKPDVEKARSFNNDIALLSDKLGKKITPNDIPNEAYELYFEHGVPLEKAFNLVQGNINKVQTEKTQIEQEAIKKLKANASSSVGSLGQAGEEAPTDFTKMSSKEFEAVKERVKRGERIRF